MKRYAGLVILALGLTFSPSAQEDDYSWMEGGSGFPWSWDEDEEDEDSSPGGEGDLYSEDLTLDSVPPEEDPSPEGEADGYRFSGLPEEDPSVFPEEEEDFYLSTAGWETETEPAADPYASPETFARFSRYEIISDGGMADGELLAKELEGRFAVYNRLFRFDTVRLEAPLRVRSFADAGDYNYYVSQKLGYSRPGAVYLHYRDPGKRELVVHRGGGEERLLSHQAFIQFFRAFVDNPPAWMRDGFAVYFSTLYGAGNGGGGNVSYTENLAWLETLKALGEDLPPLSSILWGDIDGPPLQAEMLSWALVSFLLNGGGEGYFRILTDCFMILKPEASAAQNGEEVANRITRWNDLETLEKDYRAYISSRRSFAGLVNEGRDAYTEGDTRRAELSFRAALDQKGDHYLPYYYLGLLSSKGRDYDGAERYYRSALKYGADPALTAYARGINALLAGRTGDAADFLDAAAAASPERYLDKANKLNPRLRR